MQINKACTTRGTRKRILVKVSWSWESQGGLQAHLGLQNTSQLCGKRKILNRAFGRIYFILIWRVALFYFFLDKKIICEIGLLFKLKTYLGFRFFFCRYLIYTQSILGSWMACVFFFQTCSLSLVTSCLHSLCVMFSLVFYIFFSQFIGL